MKGYKDFHEEMILRDYLAYDRTRLALSRTFLAYVRTVIGLFASGAGLVVLQNRRLFEIIGYLFIGCSVAVFFVGISYCSRYRRRLDELQDEGAEEEH
jgi:putative membrane protein